MKKSVLLVSLLLPFLAFAQPKADSDAIKSMCGCYEVTFNFAETFSPDTAYKAHPSHKSKGLELAVLVEDKPGFISIQHLLIVDDTSIVKHWRQDWTWQPKQTYQYDINNTWRSKPIKNSKGQWKQQVFQVDDSPRYEGTATWFHADGRNFWENTTDSPLPRREFTTRSDYNVLKRRNRNEMFAWGWLHEQDNTKIKRNLNTTDIVIAEEKGLNTYVKLPTDKCKTAQIWWDKNKNYWAKVRKVWAIYYATNTDFTLAKTVDGKPLFMHLFNLPITATEQEIKTVIDKAYSKAEPKVKVGS